MSSASNGRAREHRVSRGRWAGLTPEMRFFAKVEPADGMECWNWLGATKGNGYGLFWDGSRHIGPHRWAYEAFRTEIPDGLQIDHLCRNRACVNPWHLEPVTNRENSLRAPSYQRAKTHCPSNHEYTPENTRIYRTYRYCRACEADRSKRRRGGAA